MKRISVVFCAVVLVLFFAASAVAVTQLHVIRRADNSLCVMTCQASTCSACNAITGGFSSQPSVIWDEAMQKYVLMGAGNNGISVWRRIFNPDGTPFSAWEQIMTNVTPGPISPVGSAGGGTFPAFKEVSFGLVGVSNGAGVITNMHSLTYTVRAAGDVHAMATGYCNIPVSGSTTQFTIHLASTATQDWPANNPGFYFFPNGSNMAQVSFAVAQSFTASTGTNTNIYLNFKNITGQSGITCGGRITAVYTARTLP